MTLSTIWPLKVPVPLPLLTKIAPPWLAPWTLLREMSYSSEPLKDAPRIKIPALSLFASPIQVVVVESQIDDGVVDQRQIEVVAFVVGEDIV